jgi:hypothetical protein
MTHDPVRGWPADDDAFDRALRSAHAVAVASVSAATRAQLRPRLRAVRAPASASRTWRFAAAALSVVLASGVVWRLEGLRNAQRDRPLVAGTVAADGDTLAVIDETPDLYLWLASPDADQFASE